MRLRIRNGPKILAVLYTLELLNYIITTSFFNAYSTLADVVLSVALLLFFLLFAGKPHISVMAFLISILLIIKCATANDVIRCSERGSSLIIQIFLFFELPLCYFRDENNRPEEFRERFIQYSSRVLNIISYVNIILILYCVMTRSFYVAGIKIGEPITNRYNGIFRTDAFCAELAIADILFTGINKSRARKFILFHTVISIIAIILSGTRAAMVAMIALGILLVFNRLTGTTSIIVKTMTFFGCLAALAGIILLNVAVNIDALSSSRWSIWTATIREVFEDFHLLGNNDIEIELLTNIKLFSGGTHNAYIQLMYNMGIPFFILAMAYIFSRMNIMRVFNARYSDGRQFILSGIVAILVFNLFEAHLFFFRSLMSIGLWYLLLIMKLTQDYPRI